MNEAETIISDGTRVEVVALLAALASLRVILVERAHALRGEPLIFRQSDLGHSAGPSQVAGFMSSSERLLTAREIGMELGPSWTPKKLYRLRSSMPESLTVRKGGRLYFRETAFKEWLRTR